MPANSFPVANLTEQEVAEIKSLEKALNRTKPNGEKILVAYSKA
ncbi:Hypothetical protein DEACI_0428 [Acididesulfobacillus acetoxydans]|uniref:Uncharacterized protein n=1 Tax=Acididesulfobacillus acetoxydans TaxID=1561005 RepID=A0A8S0W6F5_9FIRM|nr:hypothetical protein [Acididesulfobacillus acetoxydans]CAA7599799.1 Hypothetical protein DEACI_0428 [Acididesulfobacillus acetoxydans]CEJ07365.1 Hypothetical protein DEACI_1828 [Acididesulfobacillus acetoxydans]